MQTALPNTVICDECGAEAQVRSYGRVEYDWPIDRFDGQVATTPSITWARLTVDCPHCGVKPQDAHIGGLSTSLDNVSVPTRLLRSRSTRFSHRSRESR